MYKNLSRGSLIYVADPMCSWCYGFQPELDKVRSGSGLDVSLVLGGLYTGDRTVALDDSMRGYLRDTWQRVHELSGQPIALDLLDWPDWTYDTSLACRAVVAMRTVAPDAALTYFERLQGGFYASNLDLTDTAVLLDLADTVDCDIERFATLLDQEHLAQDDFDEARRLGVSGFPVLFLDTGDERVPIATGFTRADSMLRTIEVLR